MSWDVMVQNFRGNPPADDDLESEPEPLGTAAAIRKRIDAHLPGIDWSDSQYGIYENPDFSIEFEIGNEKPITHIMLSVRGGGEAFAALKSFAVPNKWSLFDCSESTFLDLSISTAPGFEGFQELRDRALPKAGRKSKKTSPKKKRSQPAPKSTARPKSKRKPKQG